MTTVHPYVAIAEMSWRHDRVQGEVKRSHTDRRTTGGRHRVPRFGRKTDLG